MAGTDRRDRFASLRLTGRLWVFGAIHGNYTGLCRLHDHLYDAFEPGDRLVYTGNMVGRGGATLQTLSEILSMRRSLLAKHGVFAADLVYLRGAQEEMWNKLLQLQFAPDPRNVLRWMLDNGIAPVLEAYGGSVTVAEQASREGAVQLTKWTGTLQEALRAQPGHRELLSALKRAALSRRPLKAKAEQTPPPQHQGALALALEPSPSQAGRETTLEGPLCVSAGVDHRRPLAAQGDSFWWGTDRFDLLGAPVEGYHPIIRGFNPDGPSLSASPFAVTIDGGSGRGGKLLLGRFTPNGTVEEVLEG